MMGGTEGGEGHVVDWIEIKADYVSGGGSYRDLSAKYGVGKNAIARRAKADNWGVERERQRDEIGTKVIQRVADRKVDRIARIMDIGDDLTDRLAQAVRELDQALAKRKHRTKTVQYGEGGKPVREVTDEDEALEAVTVPIDRLGVRLLASALKDLRDVARVESGDTSGTGIVITFEGADAQEASG